MSYVEESNLDPRNCLGKLVLFTRHHHFRVTLLFVLFLRHQGAGFRWVIACKNFELAAESGSLQNIKERLNCGKGHGLFSEDEMLALAGQRNEIWTQRLSGRTR